MFRVAICEDESIQLDINNILVRKWAKYNSVPVKITLFKSAEEFIINDNEIKYDCILIDIKLKKIDGLELATIIRSKNSEISIIFISALNEFIEYGYDFNAINFLVKPIIENKLFKSLDRALNEKNKNESEGNSLIIKKSGEIIKVKKSEIIYCESFSHYIDIHSVNDDFTIKKRMLELEEELVNDNFLRVHRSYLVNINYIKQVGTCTVILDNNVEIPISKNKRTEVKEKYLAYF